MAQFILSPSCTNQFPFDLSLTKEFVKYFPLGGTIEEFEASAKREYLKMSSNLALVEALNGVMKNKRYADDCIISAIGVSHGIPCFYTEGLFCWDDPDDGYVNTGIHIEGIGIGFAKGCNQSFVNHEKIHAAQRHYINNGIMPLKNGFLGFTRNIDDVFLRLRKEVYAYWFGNPKSLIDNDQNLLANKLTGETLEKLKSSYLLASDSVRLLELIQIMGLLDKTTTRTIDLKAAIAIRLLKEPDFDTFYSWFVLEVKKHLK
jgi:hypothetical protein